jgi:catalase
MHGYGSHTYKLVNADNEAVYCKFHMRTNQGIKNLPVDKAGILAGTDPDYSIRDLYNAIARGEHPSWTMSVQIMTYKEAEAFKFNPFDLTKVWSQSEYPLMEVGRFTLNRNPLNYFAEIEQLAFAPSSFIPGIEASPDKMLQGRIFSYDDTHRHRLGPNFHQIPVNKPRCPVMSITYRDGFGTVDDNGGNLPNYFPNSFSLTSTRPKFLEHVDKVAGEVRRYDTSNDDNYEQVTDFWVKVLKEDEKQRLVDNIAGHLINAAPFIQERGIKNFSNVHPDFGARLRSALQRHAQVGSNL